MSLETLPRLCVQNIAGFLQSGRDLSALRKTCKRLVQATPEPGTRCLVVEVENGQTLHQLQKQYIFRFVHTLDMSWCTGVADVSALAGIHMLHMRGCKIVTDVNALAGVRTLDMSGCTGVKDVSALAGNSHSRHKLVHGRNGCECTGWYTRIVRFRRYNTRGSISPRLWMQSDTLGMKKMTVKKVSLAYGR